LKYFSDQTFLTAIYVMQEKEFTNEMLVSGKREANPTINSTLGLF
jgi:hypothetical protein